MLNDFSPNGVAQLNLFDDVQPRPHSDALMKVLDGINHFRTRESLVLPDGVLRRTGR